MPLDMEGKLLEVFSSKVILNLTSCALVCSFNVPCCCCCLFVCF